MSKQQVTQLWNKFNNYNQMDKDQCAESVKIANEAKQIVNKGETTDSKKLSELNSNNKSLSTQLASRQSEYNTTNNELNAEKSILTFIQQMLGEYNEYIPTNTNNTSTLGSSLNIELDSGINNVTSNETNI